MKRKGKTKSRKIKPANNIVEYISRKDDIDYDSLRLDSTPVVGIIHGYQNGTNIPHQVLPYKDASEKADFDEKHNEIKPSIKNNKLKVLKFIGYFGIVVGCMYQCFSFLSIYFMYPTTVEMNVTNDNIMDFPAVTVCNSNP